MSVGAHLVTDAGSSLTLPSAPKDRVISDSKLPNSVMSTSSTMATVARWRREPREAGSDPVSPFPVRSSVVRFICSSNASLGMLRPRKLHCMILLRHEIMEQAKKAAELGKLVEMVCAASI